MNEIELMKIWKSYDMKVDKVLALNKEIAFEITKKKLNRSINSLRFPKSILLIIGIPYTIMLCFVTWITYLSEAYVMMFGFGMISLIMLSTIGGYLYHLYLISKINQSDEIAEVQRSIAELKLSSYNIALLTVAQLPFWSICWVGIEAVKNAPFLYGGINLIVFLVLSSVSYWLYQNLSTRSKNSKISKIFFSGNQWDPIMKSSDILEQLKEYK